MLSSLSLSELIVIRHKRVVLGLRHRPEVAKNFWSATVRQPSPSLYINSTHIQLILTTDEEVDLSSAVIYIS